MNKKILAVWLSVLLASIIIIMIGAHSAVSIFYTKTEDAGVREITDWNVTKSDVPDENGNYTAKYEFCIPWIHNGGETLTFFSYHSNVSAYAGGKKIYSTSVNRDSSFFPVLYSDTWNQFVITKEYQGEKIMILFETPYQSVLDQEPKFLFGDETDIIEKVVEESVGGLTLSFLIMIAGVFMIGYSLFSGKNKENNLSFICLGIFATLVGIWFTINTKIILMLFPDGIQLNYLSYLILGSVSVPFMLFEKSIMDRKLHRSWNFLCIFVIASQILCVLLQLFGIYDMKQSLFITHGAIMVAIAGTILNAIIDVKLQGLNNVSKINICCAILTAAGVLADIVIFYLNDSYEREYNITKTAFLIYIVSLLMHSIVETKRLMMKGKEAQKFEELAYTDELTGLYSRTAYNSFVQKADLKEHIYTVFMYDLNNLKKCNDTYGHNCGDEYIMESARIIKESFETLGECYRIGGDEFCVIAKDVEEQDIKQCYKTMYAKVEEYNRTHGKNIMGIATGHASFDESCDETLRDTRGRADLMMYKNKTEMKKIVDKSEKYW